MKLTILQAGENPDALQPEFGLFPSFIAETFKTAGVAFTYETLRVFEGQLPSDPDGIEAVLVSGSAAGVYDDLPWIAPLRGFIQQAYEARTPMLGICFGHQIMADALGGEVRKSEKGWGLGRHAYDLTSDSPLSAHVAGRIGVVAAHQDQVITPPKQAEVYLSSAFTPNAGLVYKNGAAISIQPHPEFSADYSKALINHRRGLSYDTIVADKAVASLVDPLDRYDVARALADFLRDRAQ